MKVSKIARVSVHFIGMGWLGLLSEIRPRRRGLERAGGPVLDRSGHMVDTNVVGRDTPGVVAGERAEKRSGSCNELILSVQRAAIPINAVGIGAHEDSIGVCIAGVPGDLTTLVDRNSAAAVCLGGAVSDGAADTGILPDSVETIAAGRAVRDGASAARHYAVPGRNVSARVAARDSAAARHDDAIASIAA